MNRSTLAQFKRAPLKRFPKSRLAAKANTAAAARAAAVGRGGLGGRAAGRTGGAARSGGADAEGRSGGAGSLFGGHGFGALGAPSSGCVPAAPPFFVTSLCVSVRATARARPLEPLRRHGLGRAAALEAQAAMT